MPGLKIIQLWVPEIFKGLSEQKMFEYYGNIHVYSPGAGADKPLETNFFHKHTFSVHLPIPSKFSPI